MKIRVRASGSYSLSRHFCFTFSSAMASLQSSQYFLNSFPQLQKRQEYGDFSIYRRRLSLLVKAHHSPTSSSSQDRPGRRHALTVGLIASCVSLLDKNSAAFAAENKKGFLPVLDKKDGYTFVYPFGWQEVAIEGQDKVFKDIIEPLESVSVNLYPTSKQDIRDFGPPDQVAETLIKKVLAPPNQKTKLVEAKESDVDGRAYYTFEFIAQAPNYTRHALSVITIGNGNLYTLTTGANQRRWDKMKDKLQVVVESFKLGNG